MQWTYKECKIFINDDGTFKFCVNGKFEEAESLREAKNTIDERLKVYYNFTDDDYKKLLSKLDKRESTFVKEVLQELANHCNNAYCEMGISDDFPFNFNFTQFNEQ